MDISLREPTDKEFQQIALYIQKFELDNRELKKEQFITAFENNQLVGFGRLREHMDCTELCSLGVIETHRRQGVGEAVVVELIKKAPQKLYLTCIIPKFFSLFGFKIVIEYPDSMRKKRNYCTQELVVPETYVIMLLEKK